MSQGHPQSDGLAERMVHTLKVALRKACLGGRTSYWEDRLATVTMGYVAWFCAGLRNQAPTYAPTSNKQQSQAHGSRTYMLGTTCV